MKSPSMMEGEGNVGLDAWARLELDVILRAHRRLTIRGWEPSDYRKSEIHSVSPHELADLRAAMASDEAIRDVISTLVALSLNAIPRGEGSRWVARQAEQLLGQPVRLGCAIAAAIIQGYEPLPWDCGEHCCFRRGRAR